MIRVLYELADLEPGQDIQILESRGLIRMHLSRRLFNQAQADVLNAAAAQILDGGQWFQLFKGEIVTMVSPDDPGDGGTVARLHRGPVAEEEAQPRHRGA